MLELIYATGNPGKLIAMRDYLDGLFHVAGLEETGVSIEVDESGRDPLENAKIKAEAFFSLLGEPVLAADSGLYIDGLAPEEQPGVNVRRVGGRRLSDAEMIAHYAAIASRLGGRAVARYRNGLYIIAGEGHESGTIGDVFASEPFHLVGRPHPIRREGFPLDSISVEIASGQYYYDLPEQTSGSMFTRQAYRDFALRALTGLDEGEYAAAIGGIGAERRLREALRAAYREPSANLRAAALAALGQE